MSPKSIDYKFNGSQADNPINLFTFKGQKNGTSKSN